MTTPFLYIPTFAPIVNGASVPNGLLYTYEAGTTNPKPTFQDPAGIQPNTNPVQLDITGAATVRLEPGAYHFVLMDSTSTTVMWDQDFYNAPYLTVDDLYAMLSPQTAAEAAAGAIPVNLNYPPLYVDRYGTNVLPGTTSMTTAFQTAINVMRQAGGKIRWGATAPYLLDGTLDCTYGSSANQNGLYFDGSDAPVATDGHGSNSPGIIATHNGYIFDLTGCDAYSFNNMSIGTDATIFPQVCFLMARAAVSGNNSQIPRFNNVRVSGSFSKSLMYNYASENGVYVGCYFANQCTTAGTKVVTITATNYLNLTSSFVTIRTGSQSCTDHEFIGGQFWNAAGTSTSDVFYLDNCAGLKVHDCWMLNSSATTGGRAYFYVETVNGAAGHVKLRDIVGEDTNFYHQYGVFFNNNVSTPSDWTIQACYLPNTVAPISAGASVTLDKFDVGHITQQTGNAFAAAGTVQYSTIDGGISLPLSLGISKQNLLIGDVSSWTISSRNKDHWIDTGLGQYSFTANTSGITFSGGTPTKSANISYHGRQATVNISLSGQTTLTTTAGQQISGLPAAAAQSSAQVTVWDQTSNISLGAGYISGSAITLPAFTATSHTVQITATYFVS